MKQQDSINKRKQSKRETAMRTRNRVKMPMANRDLWAGK